VVSGVSIEACRIDIFEGLWFLKCLCCLHGMVMRLRADVGDEMLRRY